MNFLIEKKKEIVKYLIKNKPVYNTFIGYSQKNNYSVLVNFFIKSLSIEDYYNYNNWTFKIIKECYNPHEGNITSFENSKLTKNMIDHFVNLTGYSYKEHLNSKQQMYNCHGICVYAGDKENSLETINDILEFDKELS